MLSSTQKLTISACFIDPRDQAATSSATVSVAGQRADSTLTQRLLQKALILSKFSDEPPDRAEALISIAVTHAVSHSQPTDKAKILRSTVIAAGQTLE